MCRPVDGNITENNLTWPMMRTSDRPASRNFARSGTANPLKALAAIILVTLGLWSCSLHADELSAAQQAEVFDEAIHILGGNANVQSKWTDDIRYRIIGQVSTDAQAHLSTTLQDIAKYTGLTVSKATNPDTTATDFMSAIEQSPNRQWQPCSDEISVCANLLVLVTDVDTMRDVAQAIPLRPVYLRSLEDNGGASCFFAPSINPRQEIVRAVVFVSSDLAEPMLQTCLQEEIYQSFGLFNDFSGSQYFSFNNVVAPKSITHYDRTLLASVYDPAFQPGAPVFRITARFMELLGYERFRR